MSKLNQKIRTGLRKNSALLLDDLSLKTESPEAVKNSLSKIAALLKQEDQINLDRKKLSRQIGLARKENKDPAAIIEGVSGLTAQIKLLSSQIDDEITIIEQACKPNESLQLPSMPKHLLVVSKALESDVSALTLTHSDVIDEVEWQRYVDSVNHSNVYHHARWCALIKQNFGHTPHYITCRKPNGELCGVFPTVHLKSRLFGSFVVSMPYFNYGGPLSEYVEVEQQMLAYAADLGDELECSHMEVRETHSREGWLSKQHKVTMILPLPESDQKLDKQLGAKVRAQVKKAAQADLHYQVGGAELLGQFYQVFSHNMRDLGTPVYSKQFFASILEQFSDSASIAIVSHNNKPVAVGFLLGHNDKLEIPWASSLRKANPLGANMYMYRQILKTAVERGYAFFDFGRSSKGASTYQYKKQWGAQEYPLHWHYWLKDSDELPELNPNNPKYKLVIKAWQKLPVMVANRIGPMLVRNLP